jgi:hypothetical protein
VKRLIKKYYHVKKNINLGHELRADHHAFFWLLIFKESIKSIQANLKSGVSIQDQFEKVLHLNYLITVDISNIK